jgi:ribosomal protein L11 methylase PrmA
VTRSRIPGSFRDASGFVFEEDGVLYRQVNHSFATSYDLMIRSGFYREAVSAGLLLEHDEVPARESDGDLAYKRLRPRRIPFVSYPYEWSFGQLRDAALLTLSLQRLALRHGLSLKDASAYNVQFEGSRPLFIDSLSFEAYREGQPWVAYQQFCRHFLVPLALCSYRGVALLGLLRSQIDGIPLGVASTLLPRRTWLRPSLLMHVHLHERMLRRHADIASPRETLSRARVGRNALLGVVANLAGAVRRLTWRHERTEWADYYSETEYSQAAEDEKASLVGDFIQALGPRSVWDLGANTGRYSRQASARGIATVAFDLDPVAVERNYLESRLRDDAHLLALHMDLANPSPGLGWDHEERASLRDRGPADLVLALALVHHLAIGNNVPLDRIAQAMAGWGRALAIEFVPKEDAQVARMLSRREDIFPDYSQEGFERAFGEQFRLLRREPIRDSQRILYLFQTPRAS